MDPQACLNKIKQLLAQAHLGPDAGQAKDDLVYEVEALLGWLASGGYAPDWTQ